MTGANERACANDCIDDTTLRGSMSSIMMTRDPFAQVYGKPYGERERENRTLLPCTHGERGFSVSRYISDQGGIAKH